MGGKSGISPSKRAIRYASSILAKDMTDKSSLLADMLYHIVHDLNGNQGGVIYLG